VQTCQAAATCPNWAGTGRQRLPSELIPMFNEAGLNQMGGEGPSLPQINAGYPVTTPTSPYVPCILLKAVGFTESGWKQYRADWGQTGETVVSFDFGYGIMQITSGMTTCPPPTTFDPSRVATSSRYNIGTGALFLIGKWNSVPPYIGENNPRIVEDWYFATWAYNGWGWVNNPNNSIRNASRPTFNGTQPRSWYPYQELVWGYAANPPKPYDGTPAWQAVALTLPPRSQITNPPPLHLDRPTPYHTDCYLFITPTNPLYFPLVVR